MTRRAFFWALMVLDLVALVFNLSVGQWALAVTTALTAVLIGLHLWATGGRG